MGSKHLPLKHSGIFKNLPTFSPDIKGLTAIVTGANGISGFHTMRVLLESPHRWKKVYAISRRPPPPEMIALLPEEHRSRVQHVASDFLSKPQDIAKALTDAKVTADVIFFYSYAQPKPKSGSEAWSNAQELVDINCTIRDFAPSPLPTNLPLQRLSSATFFPPSPSPPSSHLASSSKPAPKTTAFTSAQHALRS
jgi:hypothetical protein